MSLSAAAISTGTYRPLASDEISGGSAVVDDLRNSFEDLGRLTAWGVGMARGDPLATASVPVVKTAIGQTLVRMAQVMPAAAATSQPLPTIEPTADETHSTLVECTPGKLSIRELKFNVVKAALDAGFKSAAASIYYSGEAIRWYGDLYDLAAMKPKVYSVGMSLGFMLGVVAGSAYTWYQQHDEVDPACKK